MDDQPPSPFKCAECAVGFTWAAYADATNKYYPPVCAGDALLCSADCGRKWWGDRELDGFDVREDDDDGTWVASKRIHGNSWNHIWAYRLYA